MYRISIELSGNGELPALDWLRYGNDGKALLAHLLDRLSESEDSSMYINSFDLEISRDAPMYFDKGDRFFCTTRELPFKKSSCGEKVYVHEDDDDDDYTDEYYPEWD